MRRRASYLAHQATSPFSLCMLRRPIGVVQVKRCWASQGMLRWPPGLETALVRCIGRRATVRCYAGLFRPCAMDLIAGTPSQTHNQPQHSPTTSHPSLGRLTHIHASTHTHIHTSTCPNVHKSHYCRWCTLTMPLRAARRGVATTSPQAWTAPRMPRLAVSMAEAEIHPVSLTY